MATSPAPAPPSTRASSAPAPSAAPRCQVAEGTYAKFDVVAGLEISRHYDSATWTKAGAGDTVVTASFDASVGGPVGITALGITTSTKLADLVVNGAVAGAGLASYGVIVRNSTTVLVFDTVKINGGTGGSGSAGANGVSASSAPADSGMGGGGGFEPSGTYNNTDSGAGGGGAGGGGVGGNGGVVDTSTSLFGNHDAQAGQQGGIGAGGTAGGSGGPAGHRLAHRLRQQRSPDARRRRKCGCRWNERRRGRRRFGLERSSERWPLDALPLVGRWQRWRRRSGSSRWRRRWRRRLRL